MRLFLFLLMAGLYFSFEIARANTIYVSKTGNGSDGQSWETSFNTVTDAIDSATAGDEIWVASGRYIESVQLKPGLSLFGGFNGTENEEAFHLRDPKTNLTTIQSQMSNFDAVRGADSCLLDGLRMAGSSSGLSLYQGIMSISNCQLMSNICSYPGAGARIEGSTVEFSDCFFSRNETDSDGGGVYVAGGNAIFRRCVFLENSAFYSGGGLHIVNSRVELLNCLIAKNESLLSYYSYGDYGGGGIYMVRSDVFLENCTISGNEAREGAGINVETAIGFGTQKIDLKNCILLNGWDGANYHFEYCNMVNLTPHLSPENFFADPLFVDPEAGDYHLRIGSPCIDAGTPTILTQDLDGNSRPVDVSSVNRGPTAVDVGCYEFQLKKSDLTRDGKVDAEDLLIFQEKWMREGE